MATHSSLLAWKIPWTEEPGGLQSMGSQRVGHDEATSFFYILFHYGLSQNIGYSSIHYTFCIAQNIVYPFYMEVMFLMITPWSSS